MFESRARLAHIVASWLFAIGVLVQGYLAGVGLPQLGGSGDLSAHIEMGYTGMGILSIAVIVTALIARMPRSHVGLTVVLLLLYIVQTTLPAFRDGQPWLAALHPANAMILLVLAIVIAERARRGIPRRAV